MVVGASIRAKDVVTWMNVVKWGFPLGSFRDKTQGEELLGCNRGSIIRIPKQLVEIFREHSKTAISVIWLGLANGQMQPLLISLWKASEIVHELPMGHQLNVTNEQLSHPHEYVRSNRNLNGRIWSRYTVRGNIRRECSDTHTQHILKGKDQVFREHLLVQSRAICGL